MNFKRQGRTRLSTSGLVAIALISLLPMPSVFAAESVSKQEVAAILDAYVETLRAGDTYALGDLLGEQLLASRSPLWETPEYRSSLADANADTTIQIVSLLSNQNEGKAIVRISQKVGQRQLEKEIVVARPGDSVRIIDERIATD
jgi:hypothetical protein